MNRSFLVLAFCFNSFLIYAQNLSEDIITADRYEKGIYRNFYEFRTNKPSLKLNFELEEKTTSKKFDFGGCNYELILKDTTFINKEIWGVCDGNNVFINSFQLRAGIGFAKIVSFGKYTIISSYATLDEKSNGNISSGVGPVGLIGGVVLAVGAIKSEALFVLNINNGNTGYLDVPLVKEILKNDEALLNSYLQNKSKGDLEVKYEYVKKYNEAHKGEILSIDKLNPIKFTFYRRFHKKDPGDTLSIYVNDQLLKEVPSGNYFEYNFYETRSYEFCVSDNEIKKCLELNVLPESTNFIEVQYFEKSGIKELNISNVKEKVADFYIRQLNVVHRK